MAVPAFWVQEALPVRLMEPVLASVALLTNRPLEPVASKVAPESTVNVPLLVVVVLVSCSRVPVLTSTVAAAVLVRGTSRWSWLPPSCWVRRVALLVRGLPVSSA